MNRSINISRPFAQIVDIVSRRYGAYLATFLLLGMVACESTSRPTEENNKSTTSPQSRRAGIEVRKGMTPEELLAAMGEPDKILPIDDQRIQDGQEWVYNIRTETFVGPSAVKVEEVVAVDPLTGKQIIIPEPVLGMEFQSIERIYRIFIIEGIVAGWKTAEGPVETDYR